MKPGRLLFAGLFSLLCATFAWSPGARADINVENGGVIILHAVYQFCAGGCDSGGTLVLVARDAEVVSLRIRFATESHNQTVRITDDNEQSGSDAQVTCAQDQQISGRLVATGQPVLVVSETYARSRGWI